MDAGYSPGLFVAREEQIRWILQVVADRAAGRTRMRAIRLGGPKGSGKSWLLCEVGRRLRDQGWNVRHLILGEDRPCEEPFYLSSSQIRNNPNSWYDFTHQILCYLAEPLGLSSLPAPVEDCSIFLAEQYRNRPPILLVDGVDELPLDFALNFLEKYVLQPFLEEAGALAILAGRLPKAMETWNSIALRGAPELELPPFAPKATREQLNRRGLRTAPAPDIANRGGGYPQTNLILAQAIAGGARWGEALQEAAEAHLKSVPSHLRDSFWDLCVLAGFNVEEMEKLLKKSRRDCLRLLNELLATRLVRWEGQKRELEMFPGETLEVQNEYVMDPAIRRLLEECLRENDPARRKEQHYRACELYRDWATKYPINPRYPQRRAYHCCKAKAKEE